MLRDQLQRGPGYFARERCCLYTPAARQQRFKEAQAISPGKVGSIRVVKVGIMRASKRPRLFRPGKCCLFRSQ